jgi:hypothetical protein
LTAIIPLSNDYDQSTASIDTLQEDRKIMAGINQLISNIQPGEHNQDGMFSMTVETNKD